MRGLTEYACAGLWACVSGQAWLIVDTVSPGLKKVMTTIEKVKTTTKKVAMTHDD